MKKIWENYFKTNEIEKNNKIYRILGVPIFKRVVMKLVMSGKVSNYNLMEYSIKGLKEYEYQTRNNEFKHLLFCILMLIITIGLLYIGDYVKAVVSLILNIVVNIYPILLQRYNRIRIEIILLRHK